MWEIIQENKRKSVHIFIFMMFLFFVFGYSLGYIYGDIYGGIFGLLLSSILLVILTIVSFSKGHSILLSVSNAVKLHPNSNPEIMNVVEEMKIAAALPKMPDVYMINDPSPNAFAVGRLDKECAVVLTSGIIQKLNRAELQGVVAHEIAHIKNKDIDFLTFAGVLVGSMVLLSEFFWRGMIYSGGRSSKKSGGPLIIVAIIIAIAAPILAQVFYFSLSRTREYLADALAVRLTRYPEGLSSALRKISGQKIDMKKVSKITAPMFFVSPLFSKKVFSLFSTHPPIRKRIEILDKLTYGASLKNYYEAYNSVLGRKSDKLPNAFLQDSKPVPLADKTTFSKTVIDFPKRLVEDVLLANSQFIFLTCTCGLKLKLPSSYKNKPVECPKCKNKVETEAAAQPVKKEEETKKDVPTVDNSLVYTKKGTGWETFKCTCGHFIHISPLYKRNVIMCSECRREIILNYSGQEAENFYGPAI